MRMINSLPPEVLVEVLDALPVRVFWKDRESRYMGCNKRFAEDAGVADPAEFIGKSDYYFYHPDQARAFRDDDADVMFTGTPRFGILEKLTKADGRTIWLETHKMPLRGAGGEVIGVIPTFLRYVEAPQDDVTEMHVVQSMHERKQMMFDFADAFVSLPGGIGTMDETIEMMTWLQLERHEKPIVLVDTNGYWSAFDALMQKIVTEGFARPNLLGLYRIAPDPDSALSILTA